MKKLLKNLVKGIAIVGLMLGSVFANNVNAQTNPHIGDWYYSYNNGWGWTSKLIWTNGDVVVGSRFNNKNPRITIAKSAEAGNKIVYFTNINLFLSREGQERNKVYVIFDGNKNSMVSYDATASTSGETVNRDTAILISEQADTWFTDHPETIADTNEFVNRLKSARFAHVKIVNSSGKEFIFKVSLNGSAQVINILESSAGGGSNPFGGTSTSGRNTNNPFQR